MTGQNLEDYWFDIMQRDWNIKELNFVLEGESVWREKDWRPESMLGRTERDLRNHMKNVIDRIKSIENVYRLSESGWKVAEKGYAVAVCLHPDKIEILWREVDLSDIVERG